MLRNIQTMSVLRRTATHNSIRQFSYGSIFSSNNYYNEYWDRGKKSQWDGGDDITDKDRNREMYFDWAEGTNRALHPSRYGAVGNARRKLRNLGWGEQHEFHRLMRSICSGNYLNLTEEQMRAAQLGYMSEDDEFMTREEDEYGVPYYKASPIYRNEVLMDKCEGRPTYEWQVPAGADRYYGYKTVSSAVDINYTDAINENDVYDWELTEEKADGLTSMHYILYNRTTDAKLLVCTMDNCINAIRKWESDTVCLFRGTDMLLSSTDSLMSPTHKHDTDLMQLGVGWSVFTGYLTEQPLLTSLICSATVIQAIRTWFMPDHLRMKRLMKEARDQELHIVLGDWLAPDWLEREHHVADNDLGVIAERYDMFAVGNDSAKGEFLVEGSKIKGQWYKFLISLELRGLRNSRMSKIDTIEEFEKDMYPKTYAQAVQDKRLDVFAHTVNNMETNRAIVACDATVDITSKLALELVTQRLTADIPVPVPLEYFEEHERVSVVF